MSDTKIKTSNIGNLAVTHALLHTDMDLTSKTVQVATPTSNTHPATKAYVDTEVANLIDSAPGTLDTLNELAAAINDDANFNATIASSIATKLPLAGGTLTGNLTLASTASGSSASPELELRRDITGVDANYIGQIKFTADNDADQNIVFAKITGKILDASDGTEDGILEITHKKAGSNNISARFRSDSLQLINGTNLTVAGTTELTGNLTVDTNTLYVDTSNNKVGIGTTSPAEKLDVVGKIKTEAVYQDGSDSGGSAFFVSQGTSTTRASVAMWPKDHGSYPGQVHIVSHSANASADSGKIMFWDYNGSAWNANGAWDKDGKLGIGTTSPDTLLHLHSSVGDTILTLEADSDDNVEHDNPQIHFLTDGGLRTAAITGGNATNEGSGHNHNALNLQSQTIRFLNSSSQDFDLASESMRIDSSGNVLFNTTDIDLGYTNGVQGVVIRNDGVIQAARNETSVNNSVLYVNKLNGEGKLVAFYKDGAAAGSLGVVSNNNIFMASNDDVGIGVGDDNLYPTTGVGNSTTGILDIGDSSAKFRHVYASGKGNFDGGVTAAVVSSTAPSSPTSSDLWFDTTSNVLYVYNGNAWDQLSNKYSASGGTKHSTGGYTYHTFLSSGTFTSGGTGTIEVLIVGGGGSGGGRHGGGGGGGGFLSGTVNVTPTNYSIVVGGGGGSVYGTGAAGNDGGNSSAFGATANGGGGGGTYSSVNGRAGGSGGGAGHGYTTGGASNQGNSGGLTGYGNAGGTTSSSNEGSGGGGAGAAGANAQPNVVGGAGGAGRQWGAWDGYYYAAGGGGGGWDESAGNGGNGGGGGGGHASGGGTGGIGGGNARNGGGNGQSALNNGVTTYAGAGGANTGSGGGGSGQANHLSYVNYSGAGGSGIVIIRYPS